MWGPAFLHYYGVTEEALWDWPFERFERHKTFIRALTERGSGGDR